MCTNCLLLTLGAEGLSNVKYDPYFIVTEPVYNMVGRRILFEENTNYTNWFIPAHHHSKSQFAAFYKCHSPQFSSPSRRTTLRRARVIISVHAALSWHFGNVTVATRRIIRTAVYRKVQHFLSNSVTASIEINYYPWVQVWFAYRRHFMIESCRKPSSGHAGRSVMKFGNHCCMHFQLPLWSYPGCDIQSWKTSGHWRASCLCI